MQTRENESMLHRSKVVIIGAGAAGLGAAQFLNKNGITDVTILEANDRIGGRVHTVQFGPYARNIIELGANWIHGGSIANPLFTQAIQRGFIGKDGTTPILERFHNCCFAKSDGTIVDLERGHRAVDKFFEAERAAYAVFFTSTPSVGEEATLHNFLHKELNSKLQEFEPEERHDVHCIFNAMLSYLRFHVSDDLNKLSLKQYGTFQEIPGGDVIVPMGISNILQSVADDLPTNCIQLNRKVSHIAWTDETNGGNVTVTCSDGSFWQASHVIVTVSLGYLKKHHQSLFSPTLPSSKVDAIERIGFGCTNKIFLEFREPFWATGTLGYMGLAWSDEDLNDANGWEKAIYGFEEVYGNPNVLAAWIAGRGSEIMETVPANAVAATCTKLLQRCTGNATIPSPSRIIRTTWRKDPLALGSYSYATPKSGLPEINTLAQPLPSASKPTLLFAGEATHTRYYSTVHGAFISGIREAQRILQANTLCKL